MGGTPSMPASPQAPPVGSSYSSVNFPLPAHSLSAASAVLGKARAAARRRGGAAGVPLPMGVAGEENFCGARGKGEEGEGGREGLPPRGESAIFPFAPAPPPSPPPPCDARRASPPYLPHASWAAAASAPGNTVHPPTSTRSPATRVVISLNFFPSLRREGKCRAASALSITSWSCDAVAAADCCNDAAGRAGVVEAVSAVGKTIEGEEINEMVGARWRRTRFVYSLPIAVDIASAASEALPLLPLIAAPSPSLAIVEGRNAAAAAAAAALPPSFTPLPPALPLPSPHKRLDSPNEALREASTGCCCEEVRRRE